MSETPKFGFKSRRQKSEEEVMAFPFPYIEVLPALTRGSVTKFRLMNGAAEMLKLKLTDNKVSYFQVEDDGDGFFLANTSELESGPAEARVNLDKSFNNKALHKRICEDWKLSPLEVLRFGLTEVNVPGYEEFVTVQIVTIETTDIENDSELNTKVDSADTKEDEIPEL